MRQSQKSNRTRSRGRKPSNPLSRSYDSNGPDVKIRGTASHIAEKYSSLARDALASGDIVMAENYYQHAEHYLRIIASAQPTNREDNRNPNANTNANANGNGNNESNNNRRKNGNGASVEVTGDEPQPEVIAVESPSVESPAAESTAVEMDVAVVDKIPGEGEQPVVEPVDTEGEKAPAPRRRRRTTYRSRKRTPADKSDDAGEKPAKAEEAAPQPAGSED